MLLSYKDMMQQMQQLDGIGQPIPFTIEVFTLGNSKKSSTLKSYSGFILARLTKQTPLIARKDEERKMVAKQVKPIKILHPKTREYRDIYPELVHSFNGQKVVYSL